MVGYECIADLAGRYSFELEARSVASNRSPLDIFAVEALAVEVLRTEGHYSKRIHKNFVALVDEVFVVEWESAPLVVCPI